MKLKQKRNTIKTSEEFESNKMGIKADNLGLAFQDLIRYSNPINSIVREVVSNCFDAHIEAEVDKPPVIRLTGKGLNSSQTYISFIDFGNGMDPEKINNIYGSLYESDKRDTNTQIGAFGIGSKSPLAYSDTYWVITVNQGIKYSYLVSNDGAEFSIVLMEQKETEESSGTSITIPVDDWDTDKFKDAIMEELKFLKKVNIEGFNRSIPDNKIVEGKNFILSTWQDGVIDSDDDSIRRYGYASSVKRDSMVICLGQVSYRLNKSIIEKEVEYEIEAFIRNPIGIKFDIGELPVTSKREDIRYTEEAVSTIISRMRKAKNELDEIDSKQKSCNTIPEVLERLQPRVYNDNRLKLSSSVSVYYNGSLEDVYYTPVSSMVGARDLVCNFNFLKIKRIYKSHGKPSTPSIYGPFTSVDNVYKNIAKELLNEENIYYYYGSLNSAKNFAITERNDEPLVVSIKDYESLEVEDSFAYGSGMKEYRVLTESYSNYLKKNIIKTNLSSDKLKESIKQFYRDLEAWIKSEAKCYDEVELTEEEKQTRNSYINEEKEDTPRYRDSNHFPYKELYIPEDGVDPVFQQEEIDFNNINPFVGDHIIYGNAKDRPNLIKAGVIALYQSFYRNVRVISLAKKNVKTLKRNHKNAIHVDEFFKGDNLCFRSFMTYLYLENRGLIYSNLRDYRRNLDLFIGDGYISKNEDILQASYAFDKLSDFMHGGYSSRMYMMNKLEDVYYNNYEKFNKFGLWRDDIISYYKILLEFEAKYPLFRLTSPEYRSNSKLKDQVVDTVIDNLRKQLEEYAGRIKNRHVRPKLIYKLKKQKNNEQT